MPAGASAQSSMSGRCGSMRRKPRATAGTDECAGTLLGAHLATAPPAMESEMARRTRIASWQDATLLAFESQQAIWLRCAKLFVGGDAARHEAERMVVEKMKFGADLAFGMMVGRAPERSLKSARRA